ncbi:MAG TPA: hypothetical protein EYG89_02855 [Bacteroidia bacterium]|nr:hypothetical protein [Bacteroidia bacterium]
MMISLVGVLGYFYFYEKDKKITTSECGEKGGKIINTLDYLVNGEESKITPGTYIQIIDPKIFEKSIGKVEGMRCPCICIVE